MGGRGQKGIHGMYSSADVEGEMKAGIGHGADVGATFMRAHLGLNA